MSRRRALATAAVTMLGIAAYAAGGVLWLVGVAFMTVAYIVLVVSL